MARTLLLVVVITALRFAALSQENSIKIGKNVFYAEWYGNAVYYSLNYEKLLPQHRRVQKTVRAGAMAYPWIYARRGWIFAFPVELNFLFGKRIKKIELGVGNTFTTGRFSHMAYQRTEGYVKDYYTQFILTGRVGCRIYTQGGFVFRGGVLPMVVYKPGYIPEADSPFIGGARKHHGTFDLGISLGLSFGYSF